MNKRPSMLSATFVKSVNVPRRYGDGRGGLGLTLLVKPSSRRGRRKSWGQSIRINGRKTTLGLGTYPVITLAMARERALENARAIAQGRDPRRASNSAPTFARAAELVLAIHQVNWKPGSRSEEGWRTSLRDYALPRLGSMRVDAVTDAAVRTVPGERMKSGREHRVPLSDRALTVLDEARQLADGAALVFPSATGRIPSQASLPKLLHKVGIDAVPHGFRSSFRDWGTPEWATPAVAAWIRSGGTIDRDLWTALRAAARGPPKD